ncbi:M56 family metallopeptidase [Ovoidimarina sediminis]|uniref:M56 family metallopeptidase n=1 Tax=Ovoidimarina sediminis TaxID=3079856 RepID=UPI00290C323B|nr:M56 family metallopeptidase [Rhodophyticola sp. MJ-SS7]MDU8942099.1 M56 family metallopeptidase [Rhodophyticola sp. MJ-SS7]
MPQISAFVEAYIDANIILTAAFAVLCLFRWGIRRLGHGDAHLLHLRLTEGMLAAAIASPLLAYGFTMVGSRLFPGVPLNATDFAVAQFLDGHLQMNAVEFESLIGIRRSFVEDVVYLNGTYVQVGVALFGLCFAISLAGVLAEVIRLRQLIRTSFVWRRFGRVDLRLSDRARVPFSTRGLIRRHIVIPSSYLAQPETLKIALAHELQHMRRGDTEWEVFLVISRPLFFWNPVYFAWKHQLEVLRELACDSAVLERRVITPRAYADCLLSVCRQAITERQKTGSLAPRVPFLDIGGAKAGRRNQATLVRRMTSIVAARSGGATDRCLFWPVLVVAGFIVAIGATAIQRHGDWSHDRLMLSTVVNLERMEIRANSGLSLDGF